MKISLRSVLLTAVAATAIASLSFAVAAAKGNAAHETDTHKMLSPDAMTWGPAPPSLPAGAEATVLTGDPSKTGLYTLRLKMPDGYRIPAHWHPTDELVTVISGTFHLGMGAKFDESQGTTLEAGGFALLPKHMNHFAWSTGGAIVQVHGMGPFKITYVNPADDPRGTAPAASK